MPSGSTITLEKNLALIPKVEHAISLERVCHYLLKLNIHISYSPAIQFLGRYIPKKTLVHVQQDIWARMIMLLFTIAKIWK